MVESIIPRPQEPERHTERELPETKIFDLLSSIGNGENKAFTLLVMRKGVIYSARALHQEVMNHQNQSRRWKMSKRTPFTHCEKSLSTIGLVTKEAVSPDGTTWGYEITDYGLTTGFDFAGILLKWSYDHPNFSLYQMFTSTVSKSVKDEATLDKKRAQATRYKIFWELATNLDNRIRQVDITNETQEYQQIISGHLYNLGRNGVISYESTQYGQPIAYYRLKETVPDKEPEPYGDKKTLSTRIYKAIIMQKPNEYLSNQQIADLLIKEYPEYGKRSKREFPYCISRVLSHFANQGYVERKKFIGGQFLSEVTLSEEQKEVIVSLVTLIDKFQKGDRQTIQEGRSFGQKVLNNPQIFSELMLKAKEASPFANATDKETTLNNILAIIQQYPNSTATQIKQILEDYDKKLGLTLIRRRLRSLVQENSIEATKTKSGNVYRIADSP